MAAQNIAELIATGYTLSQEEFLEQFPEPLLVGVGVLTAALQENSDKLRNTPVLNLDYYHSCSGSGDDALKIGAIIPIRSRKGPDWTRLTIGRGPENDVVIDDPAVSEIHCYIKRRAQELIIFDFGSTNGTKVNGAALVPPAVHALADEDVITLGQFSFQYFSPQGLFRFLGFA